MKFINIFVYSTALIFFFLYGVGTGLYRWFLFHPLQTINKTIKNNYNGKITYIWNGIVKTNNDNLLAELAKINNIQLEDNLMGSNSISPQLKSDSVKFISFGDNESENINFLLDSINARKDTSLVIHLGDMLYSRSQCVDTYSRVQYELMNSLNAPVLFTPGDNDWLDCPSKISRLDSIRETFFSKNLTLGRNPSIIENQRLKGYPENARLIKRNVAFITANVAGSNNNFDPFSKKNTLEYLKRDAANIDWITNSFDKYKDAGAFVVAIHANMFKGENIPFLYEKFAYTLFNLSNKYKKPVLLLHGDIHRFKAYQPMKSKYPFLHVIQNFGYPDIKAIEIEINPSKKIPFNITKIID
tara:strand:+ start:572 stop:1642 length:1071 start_codon:yes stop_codon:yes gene_type:complete